MSDKMKLSWHTESRQIKELIPLENNPFGKIDSVKRKRLQAKIESLGLFEIPTIDANNELLTFNKRYHILMEIGRGDELLDVRVPDRLLTERERKEVIINSNIHEGKWDKEILDDLFADIDLEAIGIDMGSIELPKDLVPEDEKPEPLYPITQKFSEKYDAILIISDNEIDTNYLQEILSLGQEKDYKSSNVGKTSVIKATDFLKAWRSR
jgi:hypothetical protein